MSKGNWYSTNVEVPGNREMVNALVAMTGDTRKLELVAKNLFGGCNFYDRNLATFMRTFLTRCNQNAKTPEEVANAFDAICQNGKLVLQEIYYWSYEGISSMQPKERLHLQQEFGDHNQVDMIMSMYDQFHEYGTTKNKVMAQLYQGCKLSDIVWKFFELLQQHMLPTGPLIYGLIMSGNPKAVDMIPNGDIIAQRYYQSTSNAFDKFVAFSSASAIATAIAPSFSPASLPSVPASSSGSVSAPNPLAKAQAKYAELISKHPYAKQMLDLLLENLVREMERQVDTFCDHADKATHLAQQQEDSRKKNEEAMKAQQLADLQKQLAGVQLPGKESLSFEQLALFQQLLATKK